MSEISAETQRILDLASENRSFVLSGGAGSGKTYSLVEAIRVLMRNEPSRRLACITYTNAAADEVRDRIENKNLWVSTIHDFMWENIKRHQNELKKVLRELIRSEDPAHNLFTLPEGDTVEDHLFEDLEEGIQYREYVRIKDGIISHDEILVLASRMSKSYPKLCRIMADLHPYIFVDEYQDTSPLVVEILLDYIRAAASNCVIGFFGDSMQAIYDGSVGSLKNRIQTGHVTEIKKEQNRRNPLLVIKLANQLRDDGLEQHPSDDLLAPNMIHGKVRHGMVRFIYSSSSALEPVRAHLGWEGKEVKELNLTHNLIASKAGFDKLMDIYDGDKVLAFVKRIRDYLKDNSAELNPEGLKFGEVLDSLQAGKTGQALRRVSPTPTMQSYIDDHPTDFQSARDTPYEVISRLYVSKDQLLDETKDSPDAVARLRSQRDELITHLFRIQKCIEAYENRQYADFVRLTDFKLRSARDKASLREAIESLASDPNKLTGKVIEEAAEFGLVKKDDRLMRFQQQKMYVYDRVAKVPFVEFQRLFRYIEGHTPFSTHHKTKGREFPRVLVILDNGGWNHYSFQQLFEGRGTESVLERTRKLFYVCCTRAMEALAVFYSNPTDEVIARAKEWFGEENVVNLDAS